MQTDAGQRQTYRHRASPRLYPAACGAGGTGLEEPLDRGRVPSQVLVGGKRQSTATAQSAKRALPGLLTETWCANGSRRARRAMQDTFASPSDSPGYLPRGITEV